MTTKEEAISWYQDIYNNPAYAMGRARYKFATHCLSEIPRGTTYLDVGCGRGEMLDFAESIGYQHNDVHGCEVSQPIIDSDPRVCYGEAQDIPYLSNRFDVVTMFDVLEHIPQGYILATLLELQRVAKKTILFTVCNTPSIVNGRDLHITKHPYEYWDGYFQAAFTGHKVTWLKNPNPCVSEMWRVDL